AFRMRLLSRSSRRERHSSFTLTCPNVNVFCSPAVQVSNSTAPWSFNPTNGIPFPNPFLPPGSPPVGPPPFFSLRPQDCRLLGRQPCLHRRDRRRLRLGVNRPLRSHLLLLLSKRRWWRLLSLISSRSLSQPIFSSIHSWTSIV